MTKESGRRLAPVDAPEQAGGIAQVFRNRIPEASYGPSGPIVPSMRNLRIRLAYDGSGYAGWQVQPGQPTIQAAIESALSGIEGRAVKVHGSGRTDAGVHALGQVASFGLDSPIPPENLKKALNRLLPREIRVLECGEASAVFHARHSAVAKTYEYRIYRDEVCPPFLRCYVYHHPYPLDEAAMVAGAAIFEGEHDFRSFASSGGNEMESTVRTIYSSRLGREDDLLVYRVRGSGFLYHMVRNIVGTLLEVGRGNLVAGDIAQIIRAKDRGAAGPMVPAKGLFLVNVEYGSETAGEPPGQR